ncbi:MAG: DUF4783 domain-containing protein [Prevotellaceae bacterium]|jgi:hypothetical protein|nr:DUF4783 domain-containing protein [Prevotellaceae bacterium]
MKRFAQILSAFLFATILLAPSHVLSNSLNVSTVFNEVESFIRNNNLEQLCQKLGDRVDLLINNEEKTLSKDQAKQLLVQFGKDNKISDFKMLHIGGKNMNHYGIGLLRTSNGNYRITLFLNIENSKTKKYAIQQLRVERDD